ncbi:unnamed protein product [Auanema sp. JU1783]|nr:unnamed protein product [Auanema sp. JU1783]
MDVSPGAYGEIDHSLFLSESFESLFNKPEFSDVTLIIDEERFEVHKIVLAARSEYFRALFYGGMKESEYQSITINEKNKAAFRLLMKYIYCGRLTLEGHKEDMVLDVLALAHKYGFPKLQCSISDYLKAVLNTRNLCNIFNISLLFSLKDLTEYCLVFADRNASEIVTTDGFSQLSLGAVTQLISRDSFCAPEIEIFNAIREWIRYDFSARDSSSQTLMKCLRLPLIGQSDLLNVVRPSNLLDPDTLLDAIEEQTKKRTTDLMHRGFMTPDVNVATAQLRATVIYGESPNNLLSGGEPPAGNMYETDLFLTRHSIGDEKGVTIQLGNPYIINTLRFNFPDRDSRMYSYVIYVSMDCKDWVRVVDYSKYLCRARQIIHFCPRVVRFIRIVGTHNSESRVVHLYSFEACYLHDIPLIDESNGVIVPSTNVATIENFATVVEGVARCRNCLLNGEVSGYDWDTGYTCHQLESGSITIQLNQPYKISSMRMLLWDCDDRYYSYYIEVSTNRENWIRIADRTKLQCRSWQMIEFDPQIVVFIKIVGVYNSANEVFHCVHFECPGDKNATEVGSRSVLSSPPHLVNYINYIP